MMLKELYRNFLIQLQQVQPLSEATIITDWVFEKVVSLKRADILKTPEKEMPPGSEYLLERTLKELLQHKPVQYVLGEGWFYNLKLKINEHVLIPRPETEELVEQLILDRRSKLTDPAILDIGTGSGCIPIAIKKQLPASNITSIDISKEALELAKENASMYYTHINFIELDFLEEANWQSLPNFDIIISNPPYIPLNEKAKLDKHVRDYEPAIALFVPDDSALIFYEKISRFGRDKLLPNGRIYLEMHEDLAKKTADLFRKDYQSAVIKKDIYGKERMLLVTA